MDDIQALSQSGRYINPRLLGTGATANVYAARTLRTGRDVAIKILHPSLTRDKASLEQFKREIQIARLIKHPGMVPVYNIMRLQGQVCMEMELLKGLTLKQYLHAKERLSVALAQKIGAKLAHILLACHKNNVIHRDLKPQNIFLSKDGRVRVLDFGIAKMTAVSDLTKTGVSLGTPEYMAPELFAGSSSDPRTDLYSLGIILFEMIAGRPPFQGDSIAELFTTHLRTPVPNIQDYNPNTPVWLKDAIEKLLEKNPVNRYQCVEELLLDLKQKQVAQKSMPSLKKTTCIHCKKETVKNLPFCTFCGFGFSSASRDGRFRLVRNVEYRNFRIPKSEKQELLQFINKTFDLDRKKIPANRKVLLSGVDKMFAELVQKQGEKDDIFFPGAGNIRGQGFCLGSLAHHRISAPHCVLYRADPAFCRADLGPGCAGGFLRFHLALYCGVNHRPDCLHYVRVVYYTIRAAAHPQTSGYFCHGFFSGPKMAAQHVPCLAGTQNR